MTEPLLHYSQEPLDLAKIETRSQPTSSHKPVGLWFSVGDEWMQWCEQEQFRVDCFAHCAEVVLADDAVILRLEGDQAIREFAAQYGVEATGRFATPSTGRRSRASTTES